MHLSGLLSRAFDRGLRYAGAMRWILGHSILHSKSRFWFLLSVSLISLGAQGFAVGLIFLYVKLIEGGAPEYVETFAGEWVRTHYGLLAFVGLFALFLAVAHLSVYFIRIIAVEWARDTEIYCGRVVLEKAAHLPDLSAPVASRLATATKLRTFAILDARYCGLTSRLMALAVPDAMALTGAAVALVLVDWQITGVVIALGAAIFLLQYPANIKAATATRRWKSLRVKQVRETQSAITRLRISPETPGSNALSIPDLYKNPAVTGSIESFVTQLRAIEMGTLATQLGTTVLIAAVIFFIGERALSGKSEWAMLITYVTLLRIASSSFSRLARYTSSMARLYPHVQDFVAFVNAANNKVRPAPLKSREWSLALEVVSDAPALSGGPAREILLDRPELTAVVTFGARDAVRPEFVVTGSATVLDQTRNRLQSGTSRRSDDTADPGESLGSVALIAKGCCGNRSQIDDVFAIRQVAGSYGLDAALDELSTLRPDLVADLQLLRSHRREVERHDDVALTPKSSQLAQIVSALVRRASIIVIERQALDELNCMSSSDPLLDRLRRDSHVMIWYDAQSIVKGSVPDMDENIALLCLDDKIVDAVDLMPPGARGRLIDKVSRLTDHGKDVPGADADSAGDQIDI